MLWNLISKFFGPLALVIVTVIAIHQCSQADRALKLAKNNQEQVQLASKIVEQAVDSSTGIQYTTNKPNIVPLEALSNPVDSSIYKALDSASKELNNVLKETKVKDNRITELQVVNARLTAKLKGQKRDTLIVYTDKTINWVYNPSDTTLNLDIDLKSKRLSYTDGKRILGFNIGAEKLYNTIWWNDGRIKIDNIDHIIIENKLPNNSFLVSAKSEYRFNADQLWIGSEAEVKINRFGVYGNYMYNPVNNNHEKSAGLKYYIFK